VQLVFFVLNPALVGKHLGKIHNIKRHSYAVSFSDQIFLGNFVLVCKAQLCCEFLYSMLGRLLFFFLINLGVLVSLCASRLIPQALKLIAILVSNNHEICETRTDNF